MQRIDRRHLIVVITSMAAVAIAGAAPVDAHTGHGVGAAWSGLFHPILGPDHVLAMVSVGVLAAIIRRPLVVPLCFISSMVLGGTLGMVGLDLPAGEVAIAVSVVALGAALVAGGTSYPMAALVLVAASGFVHGHAHGLEAPTAANPIAYVIGFVAATAALHAAGVGVGQLVSRRPAVRAAMGSLVIGAGLAFVIGIA